MKITQYDLDVPPRVSDLLAALHHVMDNHGDVWVTVGYDDDGMPQESAPVCLTINREVDGSRDTSVVLETIE